MKDPRYPIGTYEQPAAITTADRLSWIERLQQQPARLRQAVAGLSDEQLDTPYRENGWTIRQVAHHIADASMNSFFRIKLALTEDNPVIKPYEEDRWGAQIDARTTPVEASIAIVEGLHARWAVLLSSATEEEFGRTFVHPVGGVTTVEAAFSFSVWHIDHHTAHILQLRERMNW